MLLGLAACAPGGVPPAPPEAGPIEHVARVVGPLPGFAGLAWHLQGSARVEADELRFDYCCVAWGAAEASLAIGPGRWQLELAYRNTECTTAAAALVLGADGMLLAYLPLTAGKTGGTATAQFAVDADTATPRLLISELGGGYSCCGTTAVRALRTRRDLEP